MPTFQSKKPDHLHKVCIGVAEIWLERLSWPPTSRLPGGGTGEGGMNTRVERTADVFWVPPQGLLPPSLPVQQEGLQQTPQEAWSVTFGARWIQWINVWLTPEESKRQRLVEGAYKCNWEVTSLPQTAGKHINVGHTGRVGPGLC